MYFESFYIYNFSRCILKKNLYKNVSLFFCFLLLHKTEIAMGLRIVHVTVPSAIESGKNAVLVCEHDLETDTLYSVKWYKGRREFFRYTPKEIPAVKVFPLPGITVDVSIWVRIRTIKKLLFLYYLISSDILSV